MNRISEIIEEISKLKGTQQDLQTKFNTAQEELNTLTLEWQDMCSHPVEYLDEQENSDMKCSACGFIIVNEEAAAEGEVV